MQPFEVEIIAHDREDYSDFYSEFNVKAVSTEELWKESDIISIHVSRNSSTIGLYDEIVLDKLKQGVYLVNTSRGRIVDEKALYDRLKSGVISAAHMDVFEVEPAIKSNLLQVDSFQAPPHIGAYTNEAQSRIGQEIVSIVQSHSKGETPESCLNK